MKKNLSVLFAAFLATGLYAYSFEVNGIYYNITDYWGDGEETEYNCAAVCAGDAPYTGVVNIPATVSNGGTTYNVRIIEDGAFGECIRLTSVYVPSSVKKIGSSAFQGCRMLASVTLSSGLKSIDYYVFGGCASLTKIVLPNSITDLGSSLFQECTALAEVTLPNSITYLPGEFFYGCSSLASVSIPSSVTELGAGCFHGCSSLSSITLPANLQRINGDCFYGTSIKEIIIPASVTYIGGAIVGDATQAVYMQGSQAPLLNGNSLSSWYDSNLTVYIPCGALADYQTIWGTDFNYVEWNQNIAFRTVVAPEGAGYIAMQGDCNVTDIELTAKNNAGYAFVMWSDGVTTPTRTVSVNSTQTYTAMYAKAMHWQVYRVYPSEINEPVIVPDNSYRVLAEGYAIPNTSVTIEADKVWEGDNIFSYWRDGETANPRTFTITQDTVFYAQYVYGGLVGNDITYMLQDGVLDMEGTGDMYDGTTRYAEYEILSDKYEDWYVWMWYELLYQANDIKMTEGITSIGEALFYDLQTLSEVNIPASITEIRARAFEDCRKLKTIHFADKSQLKTIGDWAFYNCHNLRSLTLPEGLTTIGDGAFYGCAYLAELTLPSTTTNVADNAFALCGKLQKMRVKATTPPSIDQQTFESVSRDIPVYVPAESVGAYQSDMYWKEFNIQSDATDTENTLVDNNSNTIRKIFRSNQVLIQRGSKTYTLTGVEVR